MSVRVRFSLRGLGWSRRCCNGGGLLGFLPLFLLPFALLLFLSRLRRPLPRCLDSLFLIPQMRPPQLDHFRSGLLKVESVEFERRRLERPGKGVIAFAVVRRSGRSWIARWTLCRRFRFPSRLFPQFHLLLLDLPRDHPRYHTRSWIRPTLRIEEIWQLDSAKHPSDLLLLLLSFFRQFRCCFQRFAPFQTRTRWQLRGTFSGHGGRDEVGS